jgi:hypothetical protein
MLLFCNRLSRQWSSWQAKDGIYSGLFRLLSCSPVAHSSLLGLRVFGRHGFGAMATAVIAWINDRVGSSTVTLMQISFCFILQ